MKVQVRLMPVRFNESDRPIVVQKTVWQAMCALGARFNCPVQDVLPVRQGREFAQALEQGMKWLDARLPAHGPAETRDDRFARSVAVLVEPAVRKQVHAVIALCRKDRGLHYADLIGF